MTAPADVGAAQERFLEAASRLHTVAPLYVACACGCGQSFLPRAYRGLVQRFVWGHNARGRRSARVGYGHYHKRVREERGTPRNCENCGTTDPLERYEWASISKNYADPNDYKRLCKPCHARFDNLGPLISALKTGVARPDMQGERHPQAKLIEDEVRAIRARYSVGDSGALAREFGVSRSTILRVVRFQSWGYVFA